MKINENPLNVPKKRTLSELIHQGVSSIRTGLRRLFSEDPRITEILTPAFLHEFYTEYLRMCKERREGIFDPDSQASFLDVMEVNGNDMQYRIFEALLAQYPQIKMLPDDIRHKLRFQLLDHCGLVPGLA